MARTEMESCCKAAIFVIFLSALLVGCSKKQAETPAAAAPADTGTTATAAQQAAAPAQEGPAIIVNNVNTADTKATMSAAAAAIKAKQYEDATKLILALQAQKLSEQQAAAVHNQMIQLQQNVANGVASGDPNAQAAAEMLRASSMRH
jgi:hypothetical protein